jgi:hypothetical protein
MRRVRTAGSNSKRTGDLPFYDSFYVFLPKKQLFKSKNSTFPKSVGFPTLLSPPAKS